VKRQIHDLCEGGVHLLHQGPWKASERPLDEPTVVDGSELVNKKVGVALDLPSCGDTNAEGLGFVHQTGGEGNDKGGGVFSVQESLALNDKDWPGLPRLRAARRVQIG
jgi:hypothetical protein